jgi:hypothetical protein
MKNRLFRIIFGIRPTVGHPAAGSIHDGILLLFIFAESVDQASERALAIVKALPYEIVGKHHEITHGDLTRCRVEPGHLNSDYQAAIQNAWETGIGMRFWLTSTPDDAGWLEAFHTAFD